jgi:ABC-type transport system substrate-binding protein
MPSAYIFTDPLISAIAAIPKHLYEQYPTSGWSSGVLSGFTSGGSLSTSSYTYHWDKAAYGGNGTYTAYGPVTDGPYIYHGYDPTSQTATLVKNPLYWNKTGLESLGQYTAKTIHVVHVTEKTAAIAAFGNKVFNAMDPQYTFSKADAAAIVHAGGLPVQVSDPANGYQDLVLNDNSPIWGTGTTTPLGQSNPAQAHQAALLVRKAMSYLIPRQDIVDNLLQGIGAAAISEFYQSPNTGIYHDIYNGISPDPYDPTAAIGFLACAGYNTGVACSGSIVPPPPTTIILPSPPVITATCTTTAPTGGVKAVTVSAPSFLLGSSVTLDAPSFVIPGAFAGTGGAGITLQQSLDNGSSWLPVAMGSTNEGGYYSISYQPKVTGWQQYRVFFTGVPQTQINALSMSSPGRLESRVPPQTKTNGLSNLNITNTQYGPVTTIKVGTLSEFGTSLSNAINQALGTLSNSTVLSVNNGLCTLQKSLSNSTSVALAKLNDNIKSSFNTAIGTLQTNLQTSSAKASDVTALNSNVATLSSNVDSLKAQVATLTTIAYIALAIAIILGLAAIFLARRRPRV